MNEEALFHLALDQPPEKRAAFLDDVCSGDALLRSRVERLLHAHHHPDSFLGQPAVNVAEMIDLGSDEPDSETSDDSTLAPSSVAEGPENHIGPYKLLQQIGEGGFGVVYLAEQQEPVRRRVAVKIIKPGMDTRAVVARFEAERQALALMDHPHIAKVLDAGSTASGRPYFVMELVKGIPITDYCDRSNLTTQDRLELFVAVCKAVQHAHQKGIIHRDLKPTNVMVAMQDGHAVPKVIDFGVAKATNVRLTEQTLHTCFTQMVGTPMYMSPEQAEMSPLEVDTRSDVYSLGVLLYELLTGTTPFDKGRLKGVGYGELRRIIREEEPPKPSNRLSTLNAADLSTIAEHRRTDPRRLSQLVRGDLDWIVMKALDKDRSRRYETANAFARDVERYLGEEAVEACPPSTVYRLGKFARRNRVALATTAVVVICLLSSTALATWQAIAAQQAAQREAQAAEEARQQGTEAIRQRNIARIEAHKAAVQRDAAETATQLAKTQEELARQQRDLTLRNLYVAHMKLAHQDWNAGFLSRMTTTLDVHRPQKDLPDLRGWEWYYLTSLTQKNKNSFNPQLGPINNVDWSPDGRLVAMGGRLGAIIYEPVSQQIVHSFPGHLRAVWSPDGLRLATVTTNQEKPQIIIWNTENWQEIRALASGGPVGSLAWKADSRGLAWASGGRFSFWEEGQQEPAPMRYPAKEVFGIRGTAWGPEGRLLLLGGAFPSTVVFWDTVDNKPAREVDTHNRGTTHIAISPDGTRFATASIDGDIGVRAMESGELIHEFVAHSGHISTCDWSPDGKRLVSGGEDNLVRIWNADTGQQLNRFPGHRAIVRSVDCSPKEDWIVSGGGDGTVRFWRPDESQDARSMPGRGTVAWSPDGSRVVTNDPRDGETITYSILDSRTGRVVKRLQATHTGSMHVFAWSPNGKLIAGAGFHGAAYIWNADTGRLLHSIPRAHLPEKVDHGETRCIAWSPDNRLFATCGIDRLIKIWETSSGKLLHTFNEHRVALGSVCWSPDGRWLASADWGRDIKVRATDTWQIKWEIDQQPASVGAGAGGDYTIAWSPDSHRLAAVDSSGRITVRELFNETELRKLWSVEAHTSLIRGIAWSPDGSRIASGSEDRTVKVWDAETGRELMTLEGHTQMVKSVAWSPDGRRLASGGDRSLRIWDATEAYENPEVFVGAPE